MYITAYLHTPFQETTTFDETDERWNVSMIISSPVRDFAGIRLIKLIPFKFVIQQPQLDKGFTRVQVFFTIVLIFNYQ